MVGTVSGEYTKNEYIFRFFEAAHQSWKYKIFTFRVNYYMAIRN